MLLSNHHITKLIEAVRIKLADHGNCGTTVTHRLLHHYQAQMPDKDSSPPTTAQDLSHHQAHQAVGIEQHTDADLLLYLINFHIFYCSS
jgi:hypothetical protein